MIQLHQHPLFTGDVISCPEAGGVTQDKKPRTHLADEDGSEIFANEEDEDEEFLGDDYGTDESY